MSKFIFFSGKGGVGKTSMACSTAVHYAVEGKRTLIVTTDPASNLSDVFEQEIGHKVTKLSGIDNLWAMEINPDEATREYKEQALAPMRDLFDEEILQVAEEQLSGPCTEEMASFDKFIDFMDKDEYEVVVFDTAPTGHTIRLLELPIDWSKHIEESSKGSGQTCMGPVAMIQDSKQKYDDAIAKLRDLTITDFVFVTQAEQTSFEETKRSSDELKQIGIETTKVIINGLIPKSEATNPFFNQRIGMQQKWLEEAKEAFSDIEIETMELFDFELKGIEKLKISAGILFGSETDQGATDHILSDTSVEHSNIYNENTSRDKLNQLLYPAPGKRKNIFYSGKGGVGKTTLACITAVNSALKGYKTLLLTTDPAAHIGSVLDRPVTDQMSAIEGIDNLYAVKIDQKKCTEEYKEMVLRDAREKFDPTTVQAMEEELNSPCTEEMAAFQKFIEFANLEEYEVLVCDTAPTGHTLRLLELPLDWSKQIQMKAGLSVGASEADRLQKERFDRVIEMMKDKDVTTFGFVMYPEKTPVIEAYRAAQELGTLGIKTQLVVANLVIPEEQCQSPFFKNRRTMQLKYIEEIGERFSDAQLLTLNMCPTDIKGLEQLKKIVGELLD